MNICTEQVFIVNSTELEQQNVQTPAPLQRTFALPVAAMHPQEPQSSNLCLPQSSTDPMPSTHMCRLCATITELVVPIFEGEGLQNNLAEKIHQYLPIQVCEKDQLPVVLCYQCTSTLLAWHELVVCAVQADAAMRERLHLPRQGAEQQQRDVQSSQTQVKEEKSQELDIIKTILSEYLHSLNMDDQVTLVCQRCEDKPAHTTSQLAHHLTSTHHAHMYKGAVDAFVRDHVTFEEPLVSDSESNTDSGSGATNVPDTTKRAILPALLCPYCDSAFSSTTRLIQHLQKHMDICIEEGVKCCERLYKTNKEYVAHLQETHVDRLVRDPDTMCKSCSFLADSKEQLRTHVEECHAENEPRKKPKKESARNQKCIPAVCPECNQTFSNKYNMLAHMKSHKLAQVFACHKCAKEYSTKGNLARHVEVAHQGELRHACPQCGERFPRRLARDVHARLHTGDRPFRCHVCHRAFRAADTLRQHLHVHLAVRSHRCTLCGKAFRKSSHLVAHARTHRTH